MPTLAARLREPALLGRATPVLGPPPIAPAGTPTEAAVLVPVVLHPEPTILLTLRTPHLTAHAGQVSLPGGRIEPHDASPEQAALRESEEEIGLDPGSVEVVGRLPALLTGTGYRITPVVGLVTPPARTRPDPREVADLFELPVAVLTDPDGPREEDGARFGSRRARVWVVPHDRHLIWGATAAVLVSFGRLLREV
ncbi:MAG: CoA pyrophosphatase [Acetobacteraceae bacterium]